MKKKIYSGKHTQLGQYFNQNNNFVEYDISDPNSWSFLNDTESLFYIVPKTSDTFENSKKFFLAAMEAKVKHVVKLGSLGPWRVIHRQLNEFIKECGIICTNLDHAPLMNNIFTEQYNQETNTLINYRNKTPAPYVDPLSLIKLIEHLMETENPISQDIIVTGEKQYYIDDIKNILESNGYKVNKIVQSHNDQMHKNPSLTADQQLMSVLGNDYSLGKYPKISDQLLKKFSISSRTFEEFVLQDKHFYQKKFTGDKNL